MNLSAEALEEMAKEQLSNNQLKYTVIFISTLPMLVAYPFFQKYFVKGSHAWFSERVKYRVGGAAKSCSRFFF